MQIKHVYIIRRYYNLEKMSYVVAINKQINLFDVRNSVAEKATQVDKCRCFFSHTKNFIKWRNVI